MNWVTTVGKATLKSCPLHHLSCQWPRVTVSQGLLPLPSGQAGVSSAHMLAREVQSSDWGALGSHALCWTVSVVTTHTESLGLESWQLHHLTAANVVRNLVS